MSYQTREEWLLAATEDLLPTIEGRTGLQNTREIKVSCGWPSHHATRARNRAIGQCFPIDDAERTPQVFISPLLEDPFSQNKDSEDGRGVLPTLAHEIIHALLPEKVGHKAPFAHAAKELGLQGKPTATFADQCFIDDVCRPIVDRIGIYPHRGIDFTTATAKKQTTRMLKVACPDCGYTIRTTSKWIEIGLPTCPCGTMMECP